MRPLLPSAQRSTFPHYSTSLGSSWTRRRTPLNNMNVTRNHSHNGSPNSQPHIQPTESTARFSFTLQGRCWRCQTGEIRAWSSQCVSWGADYAYHPVAPVPVAFAAQTVSRALWAVAVNKVVDISCVATRAVNTKSQWTHWGSECSIGTCGTGRHAEHAHSNSLCEVLSQRQPLAFVGYSSFHLNKSTLIAGAAISESLRGDCAGVPLAVWALLGWGQDDKADEENHHTFNERINDKIIVVISIISTGGWIR